MVNLFPIRPMVVSKGGNLHISPTILIRVAIHQYHPISLDREDLVILVALVTLMGGMVAQIHLTVAQIHLTVAMGVQIHLTVAMGVHLDHPIHPQHPVVSFLCLPAERNST